MPGCWAGFGQASVQPLAGSSGQAGSAGRQARAAKLQALLRAHAVPRAVRKSCDELRASLGLHSQPAQRGGLEVGS